MGFRVQISGCWPVLPPLLCVPREPADRPGVGGGFPPREEQVGEPAPDAHPALRLLQHRGQELPAGGRRGEPGAEQRGGSPLRLRFLTEPCPDLGTPLPAGAGPAPGGAELREHRLSRPRSLLEADTSLAPKLLLPSLLGAAVWAPQREGDFGQGPPWSSAEPRGEIQVKGRLAALVCAVSCQQEGLWASISPLPP